MKGGKGDHHPSTEHLEPVRRLRGQHHSLAADFPWEEPPKFPKGEMSIGSRKYITDKSTTKTASTTAAKTATHQQQIETHSKI